MEASETNTVVTVDKDVARLVTDRRNRLGMSQRQLAMRARIDRETLKKLEDGYAGTRDTTVAVVMATLDALEHEMEIGPGPAQSSEEMVEFRYGEAVVRGPVRNSAELEEALVRLVQRLGLGGGKP